MFFCEVCVSPPSADVVTQSCRMCNNLALWCQQHCGDAELHSGLCRQHFVSHFADCICCSQGSEDVLSDWQECPEEGCQYEVRICNTCELPQAPQAAFKCVSCWRLGDRLCRICGETPSQTEFKFRRCCVACFSSHYPAAVNLQIQEESQAYLASVAEEQTWTGQEPALQGLLMPLDDSFELPRYSAEAEYLSPEHCRICFSTYGPQGLEQHLQEFHGCTHAQYRRLINRRVLKEWPQRPEPQVLRTRMAAFKTKL